MLPYTSSIFFASLEQSQKEQVLKEVADEAAKRFKYYQSAIKEGVAMPHLKAEERLNAYKTRAPEVWARLQAQFPMEYTRQIGDWERLAMNELRKPKKSIMQSAEAKTSMFEASPQEG